MEDEPKWLKEAEVFLTRLKLQEGYKVVHRPPDKPIPSKPKALATQGEARAKRNYLMR